MSNQSRFHKRIESLFADIERLASDPAAESQAIQGQIEKLRARLGRLEGEFQKMEKQPETPAAVVTPQPVAEETPQHSAPTVYEKEFVGYAFSGEQVQPLRGSLTSKVEETTSVPLIISGQPIGKMQVTSASSRKLLPEETTLLNAVAQRASQQIENLRLLSEAERARTEAESATRRFMHESWDTYLDAIHQSERVGYAYDQASVTPFVGKTSGQSGVVETVKVMDEQVGTVYVESDPAHPLSKQDRGIIASIANQVAQQVENIRLLADTSRARAEAEEATRRLTGENWRAYISQRGEDLGFLYDLNQVVRLPKDTQPQMDMSQPLTVRGEVIGVLGVAGRREMPPDAAKLAADIAERVSAQLENLRLYERTQSALSETEQLYAASAELNAANSYDDILSVIRKYMPHGNDAHLISINLFDHAWLDDKPAESIETLAAWSLFSRETAAQLPRHFKIADIPSSRQLLKPNTATVIENVGTDERLDPATRALLAQTLKSQTSTYVPLIAGGQWTGYFNINFPQPVHFSEAEIRSLMALYSQISVAINNIRLFQATQERAKREQALREITSAVRGSTNPETILRTAARELGGMLGRRTIVQMTTLTEDAQATSMEYVEGLEPTPNSTHRKDGGKE